MNTTRGPFIAVALLAVGLPVSSPLSAQDRWPGSVEASLGLSSGRSSGEYQDFSVGLSLDALLGAPLAQTDKGRVFGAIAYSAQGPGPTDDVCILTADGSCLPRFPSVGTASLLGGWERSDTRLRVLTGPALAGDAAGDWRDYRLAWVARVDAASGSLGRLALVASLRATLVPSYDEDSLQLVALGVGLRLR